jgi:hypothetical protein
MQTKSSFIYTLTKPLILLTQTGLPNKSLHAMTAALGVIGEFGHRGRGVHA